MKADSREDHSQFTLIASGLKGAIHGQHDGGGIASGANWPRFQLCRSHCQLLIYNRLAIDLQRDSPHGRLLEHTHTRPNGQGLVRRFQQENGASRRPTPCAAFK